jgi:Flp pilus assembly protein TadG
VRRAVRALGGDTRGAAAVEFALVSLPFLLLVLASIQTFLLFLFDEAIQTATQAGARSVMTGEVYSSSLNQASFKQSICNRLPSVFNCTNVMVDLQSSADYTSLNTAPLTPTYTCTGPHNTAPCTLNAFSGNYATDAASEIYILRVMYDFPVIGGGFAFANQPNGTYLMEGTAVFKSEPFPTS